MRAASGPCTVTRCGPQQPEHFLSRRVPPRFNGAHTQGAKSRKKQTKKQEEEWKARNKTLLTYIAAAGVGMIGLSYTAVPLYRLYCQVRQTVTQITTYKALKGVVHPPKNIFL